MLAPSSRTIRLADGSRAHALGQVELAFSLTAAKGEPAVTFSATFTATPLQGYDAILGLTWLERHDPKIGLGTRTIVFGRAGLPP